jgi:AcrR family transcriptional regulator
MDPRITRTRGRLQDALFELAAERGLDNVTVIDIAKRAGVNRTTFYLHYSDPETLLADAIDAVAERAGAGLPVIDIAAEEPPEQLIEFLAHADQNADLYRLVFTEPGYGVALSRLRSRLVSLIEDRMELGIVPPPVGIPPQILAAAIGGSILGVIGAWLTQEERAKPATAARWIWTVTIPASGSES